jgi:hypothetical protein
LRTLFALLTILNTLMVFGQDLPRKNGSYEISKAYHYFLHNNKGDVTKKISNKQNRPCLVYYLDTLGNVIEKVGYKIYQNRNLRHITFVELNNYEQSKITETIHYTFEDNNNHRPQYKTNYYYNFRNEIIQERQLFLKDSCIMQFDYEYDSFGNKTKTILDPTYYYLKAYDKESKIISFQQIYEGKLRWEWTYTYSDTKRVGKFKTYFKDGKDYTKEEIRIYQNGNLKQIEDKYTSQEGISEKTIFYYDKVGLLKKIELYRAFPSNTEYRLESYYDIKIRYNCKLQNEIIMRINKTIFDD